MKASHFNRTYEKQKPVFPNGPKIILKQANRRNAEQLINFVYD